MFSNGTEYMIFLDNNCNECPHFVNWESDPVNVCEVENRLSTAIMIPEFFPYEWLDRLPGQGYVCRKKAGLEAKV
jgi:hypothetical protein